MAGPVWIMALVRGLHLAATLSLLGTAGFMAWILPAAGSIPAGLRRRLIRLWRISGMISLLAGVTWFTLQAGAIAGAGSAAELWAALPIVAAHTRFGTILLVRLVLVLGATTLGIVGRGVYGTVGLAAVGVGLQGAIGHAGATGGPIGTSLVASESLHLIAAGMWLGALLPLLISVRVLPPATAASVCLRFSPIGLGCVLILAGTGLAQALQLIGSVPSLFGTRYGVIALMKVSLFLLALGLAAANRLWLTDRVALGEGRRILLASVGAETVVGLGIVMVAALLASVVPVVHEPPVWPFAWQFSLIAVREEPGFRQDLLLSLLIIGGAMLLLAAALLWRRLVLPALAALLATIFWRGPSLSMLTVQAYPTSFQTSPTGFSAQSIARGEALFPQNCGGCHGRKGDGDGLTVAGTRIQPPNLIQPHIMAHTDGALFWFVTRGIDDPKGGLVMPGFGGALSVDDRWAVIDYVRAHNAAVALQQDMAFVAPVQAPSVPIICNGVSASSMRDLLGHAVLVVLGATEVSAPAPDAITLFVSRNDLKPALGTCIAADSAAWNAYTVLANLPADAAGGLAFLVDPDGWLRVVQRPGTAGSWRSRDDLLAAIRGICAHPIEQASGALHEHHH
jgi:putative copper export protein/mono/diheme cytochrome c family protein